MNPQRVNWHLGSRMSSAILFLKILFIDAKSHELITCAAYIVIKAADEFNEKTTLRNHP
jgi:hypothetical protein